MTTTPEKDMDMTENEDVPMVVVATERGSYGNTIRVPGERFGIVGKRHLSKRWMLDPKAEPERAKQLEATYKAENGPRVRNVTDEQLEAELSEASGAMPALRAENKRLKAELNRVTGVVAELESKIADMENAGAQETTSSEAPPEEAADRETDARSAGSRRRAAEPASEDGQDEVSDGGAGAEEKPTRRTSERRRRN